MKNPKSAFKLFLSQAANILCPRSKAVFQEAGIWVAGGFVAIFSTQALAADPGTGRSQAFFERTEFTGYISQGFQSVEADDGAFDPEDANMSPGFNRFRFALGIDVDLADNINAFVELSEEPNDFGANFTPNVDLALLNIGLNDAVTFQTGTIVTVLFNYRGYSDGAAVQDNPLIGNSPADMVAAAQGVKLIGDHGRVHWDFGISSSDFFEAFGGDRGWTYVGRLSFDVTEEFGIGFGASTSNHGDQIANGSSDVIRAGFYLGDGDNYRFRSAGTGGIRNTHAGLIPGLEASAVHIDAQYKTETTILRAWAGQAEDDYSFADAMGQPTVASQSTGFVLQQSKMSFIGLEGTYYFAPKFYGAVRYTTVTNEADGVDSADELTRTQLGVGYYFRDNALFKAEVVSQTEEENSPGQIGDDWGGVMLETSFTF